MQSLPRLFSRLRLLHPERVSTCRSLTTSQVCRADYREGKKAKTCKMRLENGLTSFSKQYFQKCLQNLE